MITGETMIDETAEAVMTEIEMIEIETTVIAEVDTETIEIVVGAIMIDHGINY